MPGRLRTIFIASLLVLPAVLVYSQNNGIADQKNYLNGKVKTIIFTWGKDTIEYRTYYRNGHIKDSLWLKMEGRDEIPIKTNRSYYSNGKLASEKIHGENTEEYTLKEYYRNGQLRYIQQRPTGLTRYYNKRGREIRQYDLHKATFVSVPKQFRNGRHLDLRDIKPQIKTLKARLVKDRKKLTVRSGVIISYSTITDTNLVTHCQIEGFSKDSVYLSAFDYNQHYDRITDNAVLRYKKTFAIDVNQLRTFYYTRHNTKARKIGAKLFFALGFGTLLVPITFVPGSAKAVNDGEANYSLMGTAYGSSVAAGFIMIALSKHLYKTAVPKKFNMLNWKLLPQL